MFSFLSYLYDFERNDFVSSEQLTFIFSPLFSNLAAILTESPQISNSLDVLPAITGPVCTPIRISRGFMQAVQ